MGMKPTGNGRREFRPRADAAHTNTYMLAGGRDPAEILASVKNGIYAVSFAGGQVDITSANSSSTARRPFHRGRANHRAHKGSDADRQRPPTCIGSR